MAKSSKIVDLDDYQYAVELQEQFNREKTMEKNDLDLARKLQAQFDAKMEEDDDTQEQSNVYNLTTKVENVDNSSRLQIASSNNSSKIFNSPKFYNDELGMFIDLEGSTDWIRIPMEYKIQPLFDKLSKTYFNSIGDPYQIIWSSDKEVIKDRAFLILPADKMVLLNASSLLMRPRIDLLSILLHILIHLFINGPSKHDANFRHMMHHFNSLWRTTINLLHGFSNDSHEYKNQWWACRGSCQHYTFRGIYRSPTGMPGIQNQFFNHHQEKCGGSFFKVFEVYRTNLDGTITFVHVTHKSQMQPKPAATKHLKTNIRARVMIDLTDENSSGVSFPTSEIINLDETFEDNGDHMLADRFIANFKQKFHFNNQSEIKCPVCETQIKQNLFILHLDGCMGISRDIQIKVKKYSVFCSP